MARALDGLLDFVASDFPRTSTEAETSVAVDAPDVRSADADDRVLDGSSGGILGRFDRFLNG